MPLLLDKLDANIVLNSATDVVVQMNSTEVQAILRDANVEMTPSASPQAQVRITSLREQVVVHLGGNQFIFSDQSAGDPRQRLPEIAAEFITLLSSKQVQFNAYGYNFVVTFDVKGAHTAAEAVLDRFLRADVISKRTNVKVSGAGMRLYYEMGNAKCNLQVEPRGQEVAGPILWAAINYNYPLEPGNTPDGAMLRSDFLGKWSQFKDTLDRLFND